MNKMKKKKFHGSQVGWVERIKASLNLPNCKAKPNIPFLGYPGGWMNYEIAERVPLNAMKRTLAVESLF